MDRLSTRRVLRSPACAGWTTAGHFTVGGYRRYGRAFATRFGTFAPRHLHTGVIGRRSGATSAAVHPVHRGTPESSTHRCVSFAPVERRRRTTVSWHHDAQDSRAMHALDPAQLELAGRGRAAELGQRPDGSQPGKPERNGHGSPVDGSASVDGYGKCPPQAIHRRCAGRPTTRNRGGSHEHPQQPRFGYVSYRTPTLPAKDSTVGTWRFRLDETVAGFRSAWDAAVREVIHSPEMVAYVRGTGLSLNYGDMIDLGGEILARHGREASSARTGPGRAAPTRYAPCCSRRSVDVADTPRRHQSAGSDAEWGSCRE
jgi:hypothetical protein